MTLADEFRTKALAVADEKLRELDKVLTIIGPTRVTARELFARAWLDGQIAALNRVEFPGSAA